MKKGRRNKGKSCRLLENQGKDWGGLSPDWKTINNPLKPKINDTMEKMELVTKPIMWGN